MNQKRIGILTAQYASDSYGNLYGQSQSYLRFFQQYGKVFLITPDMEPEDINIDLLVLPGGPDVSLALQEDVKQFPYATGKDQPTYTYFFKNSLKKWIDAGVSIFGICLGMQYINVHFGGSLTHHGVGHQIRDTHPIFSLEDFETDTEDALDYVNSRHHQFIRNKQLSRDLIPLAYSFQYEELVTPNKQQTGQEIVQKLRRAYKTPDWEQFFPSCVEAFRHKSLKIGGVQWHPEDLTIGNFEVGDYVSDKIITWLLTPKKINKDEIKTATTSIDA